MSAALAFTTPGDDMGGDMLAAVRDVVQRDLVPIVGEIDRDGFYPETAMRALGRAGAYGQHLPGYRGGKPDLTAAFRAVAAAGEYCLSTSFCMWCQDAFAWYVWASDNASLKARLGEGVATGEILGGTGLSNPMKTFFGIETMRLKGRRVEGGYLVKGALPWVSNLGPDHWFGGVFEREDGRPVMTLISCAGPGVKLVDGGTFVALDGTRTYGIQLRDAFIPDADILADPAEAYVKRIRLGFVLMQVGMGLGLARGCIRLIRDVEGSLGHVNRYLDVQAPDLAARADALEREVETLAADPFDADPAIWRRVVAARLAASELAVEAAHNAMLHCGARGYVVTGEAQRRLREAYFVAIVTPAMKQLKKMLADMGPEPSGAPVMAA